MSKFCITNHNKIKKYTGVLIYVILTFVFFCYSNHYISAMNMELDYLSDVFLAARIGYISLFYEAAILICVAMYRVYVGKKFNKLDILGICTVILMFLRLIAFDYSIFNNTTINRETLAYFFEHNTLYYIINNIIGNFFLVYLFVGVFINKLEVKLYDKFVRGAKVSKSDSFTETINNKEVINNSYRNVKILSAILIYIILVVVTIFSTTYLLTPATAFVSDIDYRLLVNTQIAYLLLFVEVPILLCIAYIRIKNGMKFKKLDILGVCTFILMLLKLIAFDYGVFTSVYMTPEMYTYIYSNRTFYWNINSIIRIFYVLYFLIWLLTNKYEGVLYSKLVKILKNKINKL